uniref:Uncharacterized protein n=1 Tax=Micrurus lemniscatus lemniscatus TaxID=129467 RepID=A0A2D4J8E8_MICLE
MWLWDVQNNDFLCLKKMYKQKSTMLPVCVGWRREFFSRLILIFEMCCKQDEERAQYQQRMLGVSMVYHSPCTFLKSCFPLHYLALFIMLDGMTEGTFHSYHSHCTISLLLEGLAGD